MKSSHLFIFLLVASILLVACSESTAEPAAEATILTTNERGDFPATQEPVAATVETGRSGETYIDIARGSPAGQGQVLWPDGEIQLDAQGFVEVTVTPLNLNALGETLKFSVGLNTHSVELDMDLAGLATLEADNGLSVQALLWDAPRGGHHVSGVLSFPTEDEGKSLLETATQLTLKLVGLDAPERVFTWSLSG